MQSEKYSTGLPDIPPAWRKPLPFLYESTGVETFFTNGLDPAPRSRRVFAFHRPEMLAAWVQEPDTFRARLRELPPLIALVSGRRKSRRSPIWSARWPPTSHARSTMTGPLFWTS